MPNTDHSAPDSETRTDGPPLYADGYKSNDDYVEVYEGRRGLLLRKQFRARVRSGRNGNILFVTSEGYNNQMDLLNIVGRLFPDLPVEYI
ncbi:MAG: hypothetical protein M3R04_05930 [bacterium]|nr:hypothetical protein [bacterium]